MMCSVLGGSVKECGTRTEVLEQFRECLLNPGLVPGVSSRPGLSQLATESAAMSMHGFKGSVQLQPIRCVSGHGVAPLLGGVFLRLLPIGNAPGVNGRPSAIREARLSQMLITGPPSLLSAEACCKPLHPAVSTLFRVSPACPKVFHSKNSGT